jgi:hypothetical protein
VKRGAVSLAFLGLLFLTACSGDGETTTATVPSTQSRRTATREATSSPVPEHSPTPAPLTESTPAIVIEPSQAPVTPTQLPPVVAMPTEQLAILEPGPGSYVVSPFQVEGWGGPSYNDRVRVRLLGEDGRVLSEGSTHLLVLPGNAGRFYAEVPFEISLVAEAGRLEVSIYSPRDRQLSHLSTVDLTLLSIGHPRIYPALHGPEKLAIFSPREEAVVEGGEVLVQGAGWVDADRPLRVDILDRNGESLGSNQVWIDSPAIGQLGTYEISVKYQVDFPQWGHIAVSEIDGDIPGSVHYSSVEVWLRP